MTVTEVDTTLADFLKRVQKNRMRQEKLIKWHTDAYINGGVNLPYTGDETWVNVTVWDSDTNGKWGVDLNKTLAQLSLIAKYAMSVGGKVEKKYESTEFELSITLPDSPEYEGELKIKYYANREAVCEKKVVGTKVVPAKVTPEKIEEIVEWECKPVSLLGFDPDDNS